jgi:hypothetical protein
MALKPHFALDERLAILRATDHFRSWSSLDDQRVCVLCEKTFNGRQVGITRSRSRRYHLHCPTEGCTAGPNQWVYPGNPLISETAYRDWWRALGAKEERAASSLAKKIYHHRRYA